MEEDLRARLIADTGISAVVKRASIAWGDRPQASALPGITLDTIGGKRDQHMQGFQAAQGTLVQVDVWAADKLQARDIRELVIAAIVPVATVGTTAFQRSFLNTEPVSTFEIIETGIIYRERIDFTIWHAPAA